MEHLAEHLDSECSFSCLISFTPRLELEAQRGLGNGLLDSAFCIIHFFLPFQEGHVSRNGTCATGHRVAKGFLFKCKAPTANTPEAVPPVPLSRAS